MLEGATLDERLEILNAVGEREDPFIGAYIDDFLGRHSAQPAQRASTCLRILLDTAFPRGAPERLAARVEPNRTHCSRPPRGFASFSDPQLCAAIVRVIPLLPGGRADLLGLVDRIVDRMGRSDGLLDPRENGLLLDALEAMRAIGAPDFLGTVLAVARLSRERVVVERARAVGACTRRGRTVESFPCEAGCSWSPPARSAATATPWPPRSTSVIPMPGPARRSLRRDLRRRRDGGRDRHVGPGPRRLPVRGLGAERARPARASASSRPTTRSTPCGGPRPAASRSSSPTAVPGARTGRPGATRSGCGCTSRRSSSSASTTTSPSSCTPRNPAPSSIPSGARSTTCPPTRC